VLTSSLVLSYVARNEIKHALVHFVPGGDSEPCEHAFYARLMVGVYLDTMRALLFQTLQDLVVSIKVFYCYICYFTTLGC